VKSEVGNNARCSAMARVKQESVAIPDNIAVCCLFLSTGTGNLSEGMQGCLWDALWVGCCG
jgi:hypothetical protein